MNANFKNSPSLHMYIFMTCKISYNKVNPMSLMWHRIDLEYSLFALSRWILEVPVYSRDFSFSHTFAFSHTFSRWLSALSSIRKFGIFHVTVLGLTDLEKESARKTEKLVWIRRLCSRVQFFPRSRLDPKHSSDDIALRDCMRASQYTDKHSRPLCYSL